MHKLFVWLIKKKFDWSGSVRSPTRTSNDLGWHGQSLTSSTGHNSPFKYQTNPIFRSFTLDFFLAGSSLPRLVSKCILRWERKIEVLKSSRGQWIAYFQGFFNLVQTQNLAQNGVLRSSESCHFRLKWVGVFSDSKQGPKLSLSLSIFCPIKFW